MDLILKIFWLSCSGVGPRSEAMILTCKCSERLEYSCWCCSVIQSCPTLCDPMECSTPGFPVLLRLPELGQIHAPWFIDAIQHLILYRPLLMPSIFPSIRIFSKKSVIHIRLPNYWIFSFSLGSSSEYSGLISFKIDWFAPCCPRDSQESSPTPQFKSINSLALSFLYGPTLTSIHDYWKNHSFDYMNFGGKVMSLLFNLPSRLFITFLPRNNHLLISWLQSPS